MNAHPTPVGAATPTRSMSSVTFWPNKRRKFAD